MLYIKSSKNCLILYEILCKVRYKITYVVQMIALRYLITHCFLLPFISIQCRDILTGSHTHTKDISSSTLLRYVNLGLLFKFKSQLKPISTVNVFNLFKFIHKLIFLVYCSFIYQHVTRLQYN